LALSLGNVFTLIYIILGTSQQGLSYVNIICFSNITCLISPSLRVSPFLEDLVEGVINVVPLPTKRYAVRKRNAINESLVFKASTPSTRHCPIKRS